MLFCKKAFSVTLQNSAYNMQLYEKGTPVRVCFDEFFIFSTYIYGEKLPSRHCNVAFHLTRSSQAPKLLEILDAKSRN